LAWIGELVEMGRAAPGSALCGILAWLLRMSCKHGLTCRCCYRCIAVVTREHLDGSFQISNSSLGVMASL
jgi:hypothetical protein